MMAVQQRIFQFRRHVPRDKTKISLNVANILQKSSVQLHYHNFSVLTIIQIRKMFSLNIVTRNNTFIYIVEIVKFYFKSVVFFFSACLIFVKDDAQFHGLKFDYIGVLSNISTGLSQLKSKQNFLNLNQAIYLSLF